MKKIVLSAFVSLFLLSAMLEIQFVTPISVYPVVTRVPDHYPTILEAITFANPGDTIMVYANGPTGYRENIVINKQLTLLANPSRGEVEVAPLQEGNVFLVTADNVTIQGFTVKNAYHGILLSEAKYCKIINNTSTNNIYCGIWLYKCEGSTLIGNRLASNGDSGIDIRDSPYCTLIGNKATNNSWFGIRLVDSHQGKIIDNDATSNHKNGIVLASSDGSIVSGNNVTLNGGKGISLSWSGVCTVDHNTASNNEIGIGLSDSPGCDVYDNDIKSNDRGIYLQNSEYNVIFHNNFVYNLEQAYYEAIPGPDGYNSWRPALRGNVTVEGNYWSDYTGADADCNGIGDTPYVIDANNRDDYPLLGMFSSFHTSLGYDVNVISNSTLEAFEYFESNRTIKMHVSNSSATQLFGFCRVGISKDLMSPPYTVVIDDGLTEVLNFNDRVHDNGTHRYIYFAYEHSRHEVDIIPGFSDDAKPTKPTTEPFPTSLIVAAIAIIAVIGAALLVYFTKIKKTTGAD